MFPGFAQTIACTPLITKKKNTVSNFAFVADHSILTLMRLEEVSRRTAVSRINAFLHARLIYAANGKKQLILDSCDVFLLPTSKGLAVLEDWFYTHAGDALLYNRKVIVGALYSDCNALRLLVLERDPKTHEILFSQRLIAFIWRRMLGYDPRVYGQPDKTPNLHQTVINPRLVSTFGYVRNTQSSCLRSTGCVCHWDMRTARYWDNRGLPVLKICLPCKIESVMRTFDQFQVTQEDCSLIFTGKSVWLWILACTSVRTEREAQKLASEVLKCGFVEPFSTSISLTSGIDVFTKWNSTSTTPSTASTTSAASIPATPITPITPPTPLTFSTASSAAPSSIVDTFLGLSDQNLYRITNLGYSLLAWNDTSPSEPNSAASTIKSRHSLQQSVLTSMRDSVLNLNDAASICTKHSLKKELSKSNFSLASATSNMSNDDPGNKMVYRDVSTRETTLFLELAESICHKLESQTAIAEIATVETQKLVDLFLLKRSPLKPCISSRLKSDILRALETRNVAAFRRKLRDAQIVCRTRLNEDVLHSGDSTVFVNDFD